MHPDTSGGEGWPESGPAWQCESRRRTTFSGHVRSAHEHSAVDVDGPTPTAVRASGRRGSFPSRCRPAPPPWAGTGRSASAATPRCAPADPHHGIAQRHIKLHGLRITPRQLRRRVGTAGQVVRLQALHDLPVRLRHGLPGPVAGKVSNRQPTKRGDPLPDDTRRSPDRPPGILVSARRDSTVARISMSASTRIETCASGA